MLKTRGAELRRAAAAGAAVLPLLLLAACSSSSAAQTGSSGGNSAASASAPAGTFDDNKATGSPVKIGFLNTEGGATIDQPDVRVAAEAAAAYANDHLGGINGHVIKIDNCAEHGDAASSTVCANTFVQNQDAAVLVGDSSFTSVEAPIISKAGIPFAGYAILGPELQLPGVFAWTGGAAAQTGALAESAKAAGAKALTLFVVDAGDVAAGLEALAKPSFKAAGVDLTVTAIPIGTPDATALVTAGLSKKPGAIGIISDSSTCVATLKALQTLGFTGQRYVISTCVSPSAVSALGDTLKGVINLSWADVESSNPEAQLFRAVMAKYAPSTGFTNEAPVGYQTTLGLIRMANAGLTKGEEPTSANILAAIKSAKNVPLPIGAGATMTCDGQQLPGLPGICGKQTLAQDIGADGKATSVKIVQ